MSTHMPGFQYFLFMILHHIVLAKLVTSSIRVKIIFIFFFLFCAFEESNLSSIWVNPFMPVAPRRVLILVSYLYL